MDFQAFEGHATARNAKKIISRLFSSYLNILKNNSEFQFDQGTFNKYFCVVNPKNHLFVMIWQCKM